MPASVGEATGGKALLRSLAGSLAGSLKGSGFVLQARRWVVERTFAWLVKRRRLHALYEREVRAAA